MKTTRTQTQQQMKQQATHNSKLHKLKRKIINFSLYLLMIGSFIAMIDHPENFVLFILSIIFAGKFIGSDCVNGVNNNIFDEDDEYPDIAMVGIDPISTAMYGSSDED